MNMLEPLNVLIVEDEALLAMDLQGIVEDAGHRVVGWGMNADEAVELAETNQFDVALVDINLGNGPSGVEVARRISASSASTVVFLTANPKRIPDNFVGAVGVIAKPYTTAGLARALAYLSEGVRRPPPETERPHLLRLSPVYETAWA